MKEAHSLPIVSVRDLVRNPAEVLERVARGERFIVCRHRLPVATLQPIEGWVGDERGENECDIHGSPLGDQRREAGKLSKTQKEMLLGTNRLQRYIHQGQSDFRPAMEDLVLRGLARQSSHRGMVLTGRGMVMKEWLLQHEPHMARAVFQGDWSRPSV
jgi:prevent-host-death family protein